MRRKTIEKKRGVHFRACLLCSYVRPSFAAPLQSPARRVSAVPRLHRSGPARQLLSRQRAQTAAAAAPRPRFYKASLKKSLSTLAARPTVSVMPERSIEEKSLSTFEARAPVLTWTFSKTPRRQAAGGCAHRVRHRCMDCRLSLLQERSESFFLTKKVAGFGPLQRQRGR